MEAQQQQYHYQYQQQPSIETTQQSYDPSQIQQQQSYDPSTYYASYQQQQQDYSAYYYQQQQQQQQQQQSYQTTDPNSIHPPGVPLSVDSQQTHVLNPQSAYYPHGVMASQPASHHGYMPGGGPMRGRGRGFGRGRGGGRGKPQTARSSSSTGDQAPATKQPSRMAWCEVCRTDCTTLEVLEQHKNGKRHKKNLKVQAELMGLAKQPETLPLPPQNAEAPKTDNLPNDNTAPEPSSENKTEKQETSGPLPSQETVRNAHFAGRGGFKRKIRGGGRGGKWMRSFDGSRRPMGPPKPKQPVPLICELCNVKCESQVVFRTHITGKKHMTNMKRFQGYKEALGEGIQALYPSISHLLPSSSLVAQDAQSLATMMLSQQNLQDPEAAKVALTQLLEQHGIHDAQTLIAQLVPYLLTQLQAPGSLPTQVAATGSLPAENPGSREGAPVENPGSQEGAPVAGNENGGVENQTEEQATTTTTTTTVDSEVASGTSNEPEKVAPESESQPAQP